MIARHRQAHIVDAPDFAPALAEHNVVNRNTVFMTDIRRAHIRLRINAVSDQPPVSDAAYQRLHFRVIETDNAEPIKRRIFNKRVESIAEFFKPAPMVEMFRIDIGDNRDSRRQANERAVRLVRFDHHPVAFANPRIGTISINNAAIDNRWVKIGFIKQRRDHGGGRRLAMGARNGNGPFKTHQFGEHVRAFDHRNMTRARGGNFRIVAADRR